MLPREGRASDPRSGKALSMGQRYRPQLGRGDQLQSCLLCRECGHLATAVLHEQWCGTLDVTAFLQSLLQSWLSRCNQLKPFSRCRQRSDVPPKLCRTESAAAAARRIVLQMLQVRGRGAVLVGLARVDAALESLLQAVLLPAPGATDTFFQPDRPL